MTFSGLHIDCSARPRPQSHVEGPLVEVLIVLITRLPSLYQVFNNLQRADYLLACGCGSLWSPYVIGQTIIFSSCFFFFFLLFFSSPNLSGRKLDVYHTLAHDVALVRI